jgi:hypothetical protein
MTISLLKLAPFEDADAHRRAQLTGSSPTRILLSAILARLTKIGEGDGRAFASRLDDAAAVHRDDRTDQVAAERPNARKLAVFVRPFEGIMVVAGELRADDPPRNAPDRSGAPPGAHVLRPHRWRARVAPIQVGVTTLP